MGNRHLFSWIHISDIHVGHGDAAWGHHQKRMLLALKEDIAKSDGRGWPTPDALIVTGDIAFSGDTLSSYNDPPREYAAASEFLLSIATAARIPRSRIYIVPGNHDIQRASLRSDRDTYRLIDRLRRKEESLDNALENPTDRLRLISRAKPFFDFVQALRESLEPAPLWFSETLSPNGIPVRLIGLNTSLLCNDDSDIGQLALGGAQLNAVVGNTAELIVTLSHHPLRGRWLGDESEARPWIERRSHIHLSGHVHEPESETAMTGARGTIAYVSAGATHPGQSENVSPSGHGYNVASVMSIGGQLTLRVWPRRWSPKKSQFVQDIDNLPDDLPYADHPVEPRGLNLSDTKPAPSAALPDAIDPLSVSPKEQATQIELLIHTPVELLLNTSEKVLLWLKQPTWDREKIFSNVLKAACLLSGNEAIKWIEIGLSDTADIRNTSGTDPVTAHRFRLDASLCREIARSKQVPGDFWSRVDVLLHERENVFWGSVVCIKASELG